MTDSAQPKLTTTIALWQRWMEKQRLDSVVPQTLANRYQTIANLLIHFKRNLETEQDARDFQTFLLTRQSPRDCEPMYQNAQKFLRLVSEVGRNESQSLRRNQTCQGCRVAID